MSKPDTVKRDAIRSAATQKREALITSLEKPPRTRPNVDNIPEELKSLDRWICWKWDKRDGRWTKKPLKADGSSARINIPDDWSSFPEAFKGYQTGKRIDGIGLVLGDGYFGFDIDCCLDGGALDPKVDRFLASNPSYCEVSPTGTGLKTIFRGCAPRNWKDDEIELYENKFFTITGDLFDEYASEVSEFQSTASAGEIIDQAIESMLRIQIGSEQDGSGRLIKYANRCVRFDLDVPDALEAIRKVLEVHPTPKDFTDDEIEKRLEDAQKKLGGAKEGYRSKPIPKTQSFGELLLDETEDQFIIKNSLVLGAPAILAGGSKSMKTSIALLQAICIASGRPFLENEVLLTNKVHFFSAESGKATIKKTLIAWCKQLGIDPKSIADRLFLDWWVPRVSQLEQLTEFQEKVRAVLAGVVYIDPAYLALSGDHQSNKADNGQQLADLCQYVLSIQATPIILDHTKRSSSNAKAFEPLELEDISGDGKAEFARQWMLVGRRSKFEPTATTKTHELWLTCGGSAGHASIMAVDIDETELGPREREYTIRIRPRSCQLKHEREKKQDQQLQQRESRIEELMQRARSALSEGPMGKSDLKDTIGASKDDVREVISRMRLKPAKYKRSNGHEYDGFALPGYDSEYPE